MTTNDLRETTTTDLTAGVPDFSVAPQVLDGPSDSEETVWDNTEYAKYNGYFKSISQVRQPIRALNTWAFGKGWDADIKTTIILEGIIGRGNETFSAIMQNEGEVEDVNGDSYAEIIRGEDGALINLKPLSPSNVRVVHNKQGMITRYEMLNVEKGKEGRIKQPEQILHPTEGRVGDEVHGTSMIEAVQWIVDAKQQAKEDIKRITHWGTVRIMYVDEDDPTRLKTLRDQYKDAIKNGEVLILPGKKPDVELENVPIPPTQAYLEWVRYLDDELYREIGVPKVIATSEGFTEAGGKVGFLTFEPMYTRKQAEMEALLWNQLAIKVKFKRPPSLQTNVQEDEEKNVSQQQASQPNDTDIGAGE